MDANTLLEEFKKFKDSNDKRTSHDEYMVRKNEGFLKTLVKHEDNFDAGAERLTAAIKDIPAEVVVTNRRVFFEMEDLTRRWLLITLGSIAFLSVTAYVLGERRSQEILLKEITTLNKELLDTKEHLNYHLENSKEVEAKWQKLQAEQE